MRRFLTAPQTSSYVAAVNDAVESLAVNLTYILEQGAQGSHLLFENDEIRRAFDTDPVDDSALDGVRGMVRDLATLPTIERKRTFVEALSEEQRSLLIVLYFQYLEQWRNQGDFEGLEFR